MVRTAPSNQQDNTLHVNHGLCYPGFTDDIAGAVAENLKGGYHAQQNPVHIIYECLTNRDFGMGTPATDLDDEVFRNAAQQLYNENFGLSMVWGQQTSVQDFIGEVLAHISGVLYIDRRKG